MAAALDLLRKKISSHGCGWGGDSFASPSCREKKGARPRQTIGTRRQAARRLRSSVVKTHGREHIWVNGRMRSKVREGEEEGGNEVVGDG